MEKDLKQEINRVAHNLAQQQFPRIRKELESRCKLMMIDGKTSKEIQAYLLEASINENR